MRINQLTLDDSSIVRIIYETKLFSIGVKEGNPRKYFMIDSEYLQSIQNQSESNNEESNLQ